MTTARLLITCKDEPGIVASITSFLYSHGANITELDQHSTDPENGVFFMRLEFTTDKFDIPKESFGKEFSKTAEKFRMEWKISYSDELKKMAIMVSKHDHALLELLWRWQRKEIKADLTAVISNHPDLRQPVLQFNVPFHQAGSEKEALNLVKGADLIVLARYMQILSPKFCKEYANRIINIHHSFLPSFAGASPYKQAYERGVKLIGATAHYVTEQLDQGPIIEQDVARVSHRLNVNDMVELGRNIEKQVLARAVKWHLEDRIIVFGNKTVVFA